MVYTSEAADELSTSTLSSQEALAKTNCFLGGGDILSGSGDALFGSGGGDRDAAAITSFFAWKTLIL